MDHARIIQIQSLQEIFLYVRIGIFIVIPSDKCEENTKGNPFRNKHKNDLCPYLFNQSQINITNGCSLHSCSVIAEATFSAIFDLRVAGFWGSATLIASTISLILSKGFISGSLVHSKALETALGGYVFSSAFHSRLQYTVFN